MKGRGWAGRPGRPRRSAMPSDPAAHQLGLVAALRQQEQPDVPDPRDDGKSGSSVLKSLSGGEPPHAQENSRPPSVSHGRWPPRPCDRRSRPERPGLLESTVMQSPGASRRGDLVATPPNGTLLSAPEDSRYISGRRQTPTRSPRTRRTGCVVARDDPRRHAGRAAAGQEEDVLMHRFGQEYVGPALVGGTVQRQEALTSRHGQGLNPHARGNQYGGDEPSARWSRK